MLMPRYDARVKRKKRLEKQRKHEAKNKNRRVGHLARHRNIKDWK